MKEAYTKALLYSLKTGTPVEKALEGVLTVMKARGHQKLYHSVLRNTLTQLEHATVRPDVTVAVAKEADLKKFKAEIAAALESINADGEPVTAVDNTLVGGFVLSSKNWIVDNSYKRHLVTLYRSIIK